MLLPFFSELRRVDCSDIFVNNRFGLYQKISAQSQATYKRELFLEFRNCPQRRRIHSSTLFIIWIRLFSKECRSKLYPIFVFLQSLTVYQSRTFSIWIWYVKDGKLCTKSHVIVAKFWYLFQHIKQKLHFRKFWILLNIQNIIMICLITWLMMMGVLFVHWNIRLIWKIVCWDVQNWRR